MVLNVSQEVLQSNTVLVPQVVGNVRPDSADSPRTPPRCLQVFRFKAYSLCPWFLISSHPSHDNQVQDSLDQHVEIHY